MNIKQVIFITAVLLLPLFGWGVTLSGHVVDNATGVVIPYVNIGVLEGENGTVSNDQGYFNLELGASSPEAILRFSYIGYEVYDVSVLEIQNSCEAPCEISLKPKILEMQEVVVYPREFKEKVVGNPHPPRFMKGGFSSDSLGYELGILVRLKQRATFLKELRLHGIETTYDSVFYRLNVYEMKAKKPGRNILGKPIYITLSDIKNNEDIAIDLTPYHIVVQDDFVISLEYVKELGEGKMLFGTGILSGKLFYRRTSQGKWLSAPYGLGMSVLIRYEK